MHAAENAPRSFKCSRCGTIFTARGAESACPICHHLCRPGECEVLEASDEDY
ncbi:MAG: hypothetical protein QHH27_05865 [Clostridia bacterium]|nr:hypothetical protein [Clostridia bacterium]MDH7573061.1 hypothetical protein [Clostridia bacterium]